MDYAQHVETLPKTLLGARFAHLVIRQTLYLNDPRRTPVAIQSIDFSTASFSMRVSDFEDVGAKWILPFWDVSKFLVAPSAKILDADQQALIEDLSKRFDQPMTIAVNTAQTARTEAEIALAQEQITTWLCQNYPSLPKDSDAILTGKMSCAQWSAARQDVLKKRGVFDVDQVFATEYASNPNAGEVIKGHRIVLAEMGLLPYRGRIVRDAKTFAGSWSRPKRQKHIVTRMAFVRAMLSLLDLAYVPLFRTIYSDHELTEPRPSGFVSTTFCPDTAASLFRAGQKMQYAATYWQRVSADRLFVSFFETPELNRHFKEAEAVILGDQSNKLF